MPACSKMSLDCAHPVDEEGPPRRNGWSCPWHPYMGIAWFFIALFALAYFGFLVFYIPGLYRIIAIVIPALVLIVHVIATVVTMTIDPAELEVRKKRSQPNRFDRSAHNHVIENNYCNICQADVNESAKHCRLCNKCVSGFDHHCLWLNTCIGSRNYRWFLVTLFSALLAALLLLLYCIAFFVLYFADKESVRFNCSIPSNLTACDPILRVLGGPIPDVVFPVFVAFLGLLALIAVGLVGHLSGYHVYLMVKGMTTYDHIVIQREREQLASAAPSYQARRSFREVICSFHNVRRKSSRVTPVTDEESSVSTGSPPPTNGRRSPSSRGGSPGMANFGRTPSQSDASSDSGNGPYNLTDEQKLAETKPLVSILKPPSAVLRSPKRDDTVIEMELAALACLQPDHKTDKELPKFPSHLSPSPPPSSPSSELCASSKLILKEEDYDCGTLAFMAGGFDDEEAKVVIRAKKAKKEVKNKEEEVVRDVDDMDCSTLVAMAVVNSVVEEESSCRPIVAAEKKAEKEVVVVKEMVDRSTSPTLPPHLLPAISSNANANNSNDGKKSSVGDVELAPKDLHRAQLLAQYHHVMQEKKLQRTGSLGSVGSRPSLSSSLSLIPEMLPASRAVTDKTSKEFPSVIASPVPTAAVVGEEPVKRVSFQDQPASPIVGEAPRLIGRRLPTRPLPPIGAESHLHNESGYSLSSPRSGSRPLPPLAGMGTGNSKAYDTLSLHSTGSSTQMLHKTGSTNSLPNPDPRYSTSNVRGGKLGGARRKTPPPLTTPLALKPLPSIGISNIGEHVSPRQAQ